MSHRLLRDEPDPGLGLAGAKGSLESAQLNKLVDPLAGYPETARGLAGFVPARELPTVLVAMFEHSTQENV